MHEQTLTFSAGLGGWMRFWIGGTLQKDVWQQIGKSRHRRQCEDGRRVSLSACENMLYFHNGCIVTDRNRPFVDRKMEIWGEQSWKDVFYQSSVFAWEINSLKTAATVLNLTTLINSVCLVHKGFWKETLTNQGLVSLPSLPASCMFAAELEVCSCAVSWKIKRFQHLLLVNKLWLCVIYHPSILDRRWETPFHVSELWSGCNISLLFVEFVSNVDMVNNRALSNICSGIFLFWGWYDSNLVVRFDSDVTFLTLL